MVIKNKVYHSRNQHGCTKPAQKNANDVKCYSKRKQGEEASGLFKSYTILFTAFWKAQDKLEIDE